jgi:hypothetical protein
MRGVVLASKFDAVAILRRTDETDIKEVFDFLFWEAVHPRILPPTL